MKRLLSLILAIVLLLGIPMQAAAVSPYTMEGEFLKDLGVLKGGTDGDLMLESNLTREQMVVLISRLYGKESEAEVFMSSNTFTDLKPENKYYIPFILWAKDQGLIQGMTTTTFGIGQTVTTQQFQTVLLRSLGYTEEAKDWYNVPAFSQQIGLMQGLNFNPDAKLNRGQVAAMLVNALSLNIKGTSSPLAVKLRLVSSPGSAGKPEVLTVELSADGKSISIIFNKEIQGIKKDNYDLTGPSGEKILIESIRSDENQIELKLYEVLPSGTSKLTISGVADLSGNIIETYSTTISAKDLQKPTLSGSFGYINTIMLTFTKEMNENIIENKSNYTIIQNNNELPLPDGTILTLSRDKLSLTITLPQTINGVFTIVGLDGSVTALKAIGLMDLSGNRTDPSILNILFDDITAGLGKAVDYDKSYPGKKAALVEDDTIKIRFNVPISAATTSDFDVPGRTVEKVIIDGTNTIVLKLNVSSNTYIEGGYIDIVSNNGIKSSLGSPVDSMKLSLLDLVAPELISKEADIRRGFIELRFSEPLEADGSSLYRRDLEIVRLSDGIKLGSDEYTTALKSGDPSIIQITLKTAAKASYYSIKLSDEPSYIRDLSGNLVLTSSTIQTEGDI